jgi:hypothetical protein
LSLQFGSISSSIPTQIGLMTSLEALAFVSNQIQGTVPSELNRLTKLRSLVLNGNRLRGSLPPLDALSLLTSFHVSKNLLTGGRAALPSSLGPDCSLQVSQDSNCLDCTTTWQLCSCFPQAMACLPTTAAPTTDAVPAPSSTATIAATTATIAATTQLVAPSAVDEVTNSTTTASVSAAVIGGSVGGALGGSTILVVFLALLCRSRRRKATPRDTSSTSAIELTSEQNARYSQPPAYASTSAVSDATGNYGRLETRATSGYGVAPPSHRAEQNYSAPPPPADSYGSAPQSYTSPPAPANVDSAQTRPVF